MNKFPIIEMLALYSRYHRIDKPVWRPDYTRHLKRVRSCHCRTDGGIRKLFYSIETTSGEIFDLNYNEEDVTWTLQAGSASARHVIDRVLARILRHKHTHSRAHRIVPYRFEILPSNLIDQSGAATGLPLTWRVQPFRFQSGNIPSTQVTSIVTRHLENVMVTKHLHYVVQTDQKRFFHLVHILDQGDWRLMQEVDEEFFFVK
ncbi:MAG: hypothetical protein JJU13_18790 [Balneolaceae bacterium]|nr:hypothetical protein [Balneolaceae bacterium]